MEPAWKKRLQVIVIILVALAVLRAVYFAFKKEHNGRAVPAASKPAENTPVYDTRLDDYVTPPKIFPYDVSSARKALAGKTVWVREGNQVPYFAFDPATRQAGLKQKVGLLPPIEKLQVEDVVLQRTVASPLPGEIAIVQNQIMAVFKRPGQSGAYAFAIGTNIGNDFTFTVNNLLFLADPHELYRHWPPDVWKAIDRHEAREGMNELQVSFALGMPGTSEPGDYGNRTLEYKMNGHGVKVRFQKNKAVAITTGKASEHPG
ncbi:MAG TPA: hypothetical protein VF532_11180 [Candidatus Angelobacter sp.]